MKYINKAIVAFLLICSSMLGACACMKNTNVQDGEPTVNFLEIDHMEIEWDEINFAIDPNKKGIAIDKSSISTLNDAMLIGEDIANQCQKGSSSIEYKLTTIVHATKDGIWRFDYTRKQYWENTKDLLDQHGFYVAIDNNCNIIKMWVEEW